MGKKISHKISKDEKKNNNNNKDFHSCIKVLKPKVYITDNSNFKRLVHELTGNRNSNTTFSPPSTETQVVIEKVVPVIDLEDQRESVYTSSSSSSTREVSIDASIEILPDHYELLCNQVFCSDEDFVQVCDQICSFDDTNLQERVIGTQDMDLLANCGDYLESWLLESNQYNPNFYNGCIQKEDVSIYDYEPSWLL